MVTLLDIAGGALTLGVAAFVILCARIIVEAYYYQGSLARELERELRFRHGSFYPRCGDHLHLRVLFIQSLTPDGVFARADIRQGDLLPSLTITDFFKQSHHSRGRELELIVVEGGDGLALNQRPSRVARVIVPPPSGFQKNSSRS